MINGLGVLGWGVGGIEAEAAMLGQPITMLIPHVIGFKLTGKLKEGATATDLVLTVTEMLREKGVVGKFVEFFGDGLGHAARRSRNARQHVARVRLDLRDLPDRRRDAFVPGTVRSRPEHIALVEAYAKANRACGAKTASRIRCTRTRWNSTWARWSPASPGRSGRRTASSSAMPTRCTRSTSRKRRRSRRRRFGELSKINGEDGRNPRRRRADRGDHELHEHLESGRHGRRRPARAQCARQGTEDQALGQDQPGAGLEGGYRLSREIRRSMTTSKRSVSTRSATAARPASATRGRCCRKSPKAVQEGDLVGCSVLSGNRNFEGRIHPLVRMNFLASPPLVVAYALAGNLDVNLYERPARRGRRRQPGLSEGHLAGARRRSRRWSARTSTPTMFKSSYDSVFEGDENWNRHRLARRRDLYLGCGFDLRAQPAVLRRHDARPDPVTEIHGSTRTRAAR